MAAHAMPSTVNLTLHTLVPLLYSLPPHLPLRHQIVEVPYEQAKAMAIIQPGLLFDTTVS
jgi:hypothetical protein